VKRLVRTLTVIIGVLLALSGGAFVLVRANANHSQDSVANASGSLSGPSFGIVPGTASGSDPSGSASSPSTGAPVGTSVTASPRTTAAESPNALLFAALDAALVGTNTCLSVEDSRERTLYQHQPDIPLIPASTQKLLVAEAALVALGPDYRFTTRVVASAAPVKGQVAALWLVGAGDPMLATPEFVASTAGRVRVAGYPWTPMATLADAVAAAGITQVAGGVRGDDSFEDRLRFLPVWPPLYQQQNQVGLLSALSANEGIQYTPPQVIQAPDPPGYAAFELDRLLLGRKVQAQLGSDQTAPVGAVTVASVTSAPLSQIIEAMLRASDNWIAELLVRAIDKAAGGTGTTAGGLAIVVSHAAQAGIPMAGVHMDDGSGLSRTDRATCRELLAALDLSNQAAYSPVSAGLAVAGQTGTLALRYRGTPLAGKLRAKTGSLDNAGGMVGLVTVAAPARFAFLDNDAQSDTALLAKEDVIVGALATYTGG
jgi:D-alanyl-D-alanine carboxypeptidase/D-alanyl-D-alanine-endopeptidase (penicillin-binding protein 4)